MRRHTDISAVTYTRTVCVLLYLHYAKVVDDFTLLQHDKTLG